MAQDLNTLLQALEALNRAAQEPGKLSREQIEAEVLRLTQSVKATIAELGRQLPPELLGASAVLVDLFQSQVGTILEASGVDVERSEEMKKLSTELDMLKRTFIRS